MTSASRHLAAVLAWKPLAATAVSTALWLALIARPSPVLLSVAAAAVAATTPLVLDDTAASTLQASPATLRRRRAHRISMVLPLLGSWWALALLVVSRSNHDLPLAAHSLQLAALVGIGLAAASSPLRIDSDRPSGGTVGALAVIVAFGTAFLPERALQLLPADPAAPGAERQLIIVLAVAIAILLAGSIDPARRRRLRLTRLTRHCSTPR